jgi:GT2 family glycosyltransferase
VIIPTYWGGAKLARCLRTFREHHPNHKQWELVVVLDGGPDWVGTAQIAKDYGARFIGLNNNGGFAKAVNAGLQTTAQCAVKVLLNDDAYFETGACSRLVEAFVDLDVWVAGIRLLYPDRTIQHGGVGQDFRHRYVGLPADYPEACQDRDEFSVTGAVMAISGEFLRRIGGLDETFGMAWEDADLCMQAKQAGKKVRYVGSAWAFHEEGGTRGRDTSEKLARNRVWLRRELSAGRRFEAKWPNARSG